MRHLRKDYQSIDAWPTKRQHYVRVLQDGAWTTRVIGTSGTAQKNLAKMLAAGGLKPLIPEDEPVFLIRAQDVVGPDAVRAWANLATEAGADSDLVAAVDGWADVMEAYACTHYEGGKVPDVPPGVLEIS